MKRTSAMHFFICFFLFSFLLIGGCAGRNYLIIDYRVPVETKKLQGQTVHLEIRDLRESQTIMTPAAAAKFPKFNETYSLAWVMPGDKRILAGDHGLQGLIKTTLEKRLAAEGIGLTDDIGAAPPNLTIELKKLTLDLDDRKWIANLGYDAVLTATGHPEASETVHGSAERARIIGRKGADTVVSDLFTDAVNRLDLIKLFRNAQLAQ